MPEDMNIDLRTSHMVGEQVLARLRCCLDILVHATIYAYVCVFRDLQFSGEVIPYKMTLVIQ